MPFAGIEILESRIALYAAAGLLESGGRVSLTLVPWLRAPARATAPAGAVTLFNGPESSLASHWRRRDNGGAVAWDVDDGDLVVAPGTGDIRSLDTFTDFLLHIEFNPPATLAGTAEQDRGNSGVGLAGSYELQVLDSFNRALSGDNDVGAIYGIRDADTNASFPAGRWQRYDVRFRATRWSGNTKTSDARATVWLNGTKIHDDVSIPGGTFTFEPEAPGPRPLILQEHGNAVRYRNVWVEPLTL